MSDAIIDEICQRIMVRLKLAEDDLAHLNPPMESVTYIRLAVQTNTYRDILRMIAAVRGEDHRLMASRLWGDERKDIQLGGL